MADLTTLANLKGWLKITSSDPAQDAVLTRAIHAQSFFIESWLSRTILSQPYTEVRDGPGAGLGRYMMTFANDPVSSVSSVTIDGIVIPASPDGGLKQPGYGFDADALWLSPSGPYLNQISSINGFARGRRNVTLNYVGGFLVLPLGKTSDSRWLLPAEVRTIPTTPFQLTPQFTWLADNGVQFVATGLSLVAVPSAPAAGQYTVGTVAGVPGVYTFNTADAGKQVALSYSYVPPDIEQGCIDLVSLRNAERGRIGLVSQAIGTESTSFFQKDMPAQVATDLQQYKRVFTL